MHFAAVKASNAVNNFSFVFLYTLLAEICAIKVCEIGTCDSDVLHLS
jgi:hypothetical protein